MTLLRHQLSIETTAPIELVDVTAHIREWVRQSGVREGLLTVMALHTTARVHLNERDPALQRDMVAHLTRLVPADGAYEHNLQTVDGRDNAHAHLLGLALNASETMPVVDGAPLLGTWQSIFFVELDGPRQHRSLVLQLMGA